MRARSLAKDPLGGGATSLIRRGRCRVCPGPSLKATLRRREEKESGNQQADSVPDMRGADREPHTPQADLALDNRLAVQERGNPLVDWGRGNLQADSAPHTFRGESAQDHPRALLRGQMLPQAVGLLVYARARRSPFSAEEQPRLEFPASAVRRRPEWVASVQPRAQPYLASHRWTIQGHRAKPQR
jgi:hypothetical protein